MYVFLWTPLLTFYISLHRFHIDKTNNLSLFLVFYLNICLNSRYAYVRMYVLYDTRRVRLRVGNGTGAEQTISLRRKQSYI